MFHTLGALRNDLEKQSEAIFILLQKLLCHVLQSNSLYQFISLLKLMADNVFLALHLTIQDNFCYIPLVLTLI